MPARKWLLLKTKGRPNIFSGPYVHELESVRAAQLFVYNGVLPTSYLKMWIFVFPFMLANYVDAILIDRRWHSSIIDVRSFSGADYDTDHYLVVAKVRERLAVRKQAAQKSDRKI